MEPGEQDGARPPARPSPSLSPETVRTLRRAALRVAEARQARDEAIAVAHRAGAGMPAIGQALGMDAFAVRDALVRSGVLEPLGPKEARA